MMWRVSWQDYRGWRTADLVQPRPELHVADFATLEEAKAEHALRHSQGMAVCIGPTPDPKRTSRRSRSRFPDPALPTAKPERRLTP